MESVQYDKAVTLTIVRSYLPASCELILAQKLLHWQVPKQMPQPLVFQPLNDSSEVVPAGSMIATMPDRLIHVFEDLIVGCQILDRELRYQYLNAQAAVHGRRKREELLGRRMLDAYPGIEHTELYARIVYCMQSGSSERFDNEFLYEDGSTGIFELSIQGIPEGVLIASIDVTQEREMARHLVQLQKLEAVGRLAGGVAHDFNNLLTVIRGHCDLLQSVVDPARHQESIAAIRSAGERASRMTRQLLSISRHAEIHPELLDLAAHWNRLHEFLRSLIGGSCQLSVEFADHLPAIEIDPGQFEQTLMNLTLNARDAMPAGGQLHFRFSLFDATHAPSPLVPEMALRKYICIEVRDTGVGIPTELQSRIFEPFFTTKEVGRGTGLGLAIVHGAIRQAGGYVAVTSQANVGTTFHLFYPAVTKAGKMPTHAPNAGTEGHRHLVLLVEDEDSVRKIVKLSLETQGCQVIECSHPELAVGLLRERLHIDLLVTDVVMPQMRGPELARALRQIQPDLRVLYMSGYADESIGLKHALRPGDDFLQKPFSPSELVRRVQQLVIQ